MCPGRNDPADPQSWRTSAMLGGNPGTSDAIDLAAWMSAHGVADLFLDGDGDRLAPLLEYATGQDPNNPESSEVVDVGVEEAGGQLRSVIAFRQLIGADEIRLGAQLSGDLIDWATGPVYLGRINNGDGTSSVRFMNTLPIPADPTRYLRIEASAKP
jgi:hypothetical protein